MRLLSMQHTKNEDKLRFMPQPPNAKIIHADTYGNKAKE
jgi:hypothetical protein